MPKNSHDFSLPKTFTLKTIEEWEHVADFLINCDVKTVLLRGNLGAGKTTFTQYLVKALGSTNTVTSPTFAIVNVYDADANAIYHMDLYRLESYEELFNAGIEEYFYEKGAICIVEWPDLILDTDLVESAITVLIELVDDIRQVVVQG